MRVASANGSERARRARRGDEPQLAAEAPMAHLSWQRCADCGRLVLVRFGSSPECSCARTGRAPGIPTGLPPLPDRDGERPEATAAASASSLALLTPEQDAIARRLLRQALPDGFDL